MLALKSLGPYEILAPLGAGGMGEVYRARDTRLDRVIAVKVLHSQLAEQPDLRDRFEREARALAGLNHPHICALYDIGRDSAVDYLMMEYLEGASLERKLEEGALPIDQAILWALQLAEALDQAHRRGVLHRDIKPGNIMLTASGVKLMDFGLAKTSRPPVVADTTRLAYSMLTVEGAILGTIPYMAPEQLTGREVDTRTDIFALGRVFYEMLTGRRPFQADSQAGLIAAILSSEPEPPSVVRGQPGAVSPLLDHVVAQCLAKDPEERWQTARDLMLQLEWIGEGGVRNEAPRLPRRRKTPVAWWISGILAVVLLGIAVLLALDYFRPRPQLVQVVRASLLPPSDYFFQRGNFSVSPDGTRLAFVGVGTDGKSSLWIRTFSSATAQQVNGTDGAMLPFWAPDSRRLGFFADEKLSIVDVASGAVRILCEAPLGRCGGTWSRSGIIIFAPYVSGPLYRIPESGGVLTQVTRIPRPGSGQRHTWPFFLPDGKHFLYCVDLSSAGHYDGPEGIDAGEACCLSVRPSMWNDLAQARPVGLEAHDSYLKGDLLLHDSPADAVRYFERAIELDPRYAPAYAGLAEAYYWPAWDWGTVAPGEAFRKGQAAALKALQLDPASAEGHTSLAWAKLMYGWNWREAESEIRQAISLSPNNAWARHHYSRILAVTGRFDEALRESRRMLELDPLDFKSGGNLVWTSYLARRYEESIRENLRMLQMHPSIHGFHQFLAWNYQAQGRFPDAIRELQPLERDGDIPAAELGFIYGISGNRPAACATLDKVLAVSKQRYVPPYYIALLYSGLRNNDETFNWLEKAFQEHSPFLVYLKTDPMLDTLRSDRRFAELLDRMGFS